MLTTDAAEGIPAVRSRQQAEGEQQRKRAEARHDQIDISGTDIVDHAVMRHDQRPRRQRHEFPRHKKCERIVGEYDDVHAGEKCRIELSTRCGACSWRPYPSANRLAAAAPRLTTARKNAESASRRKCAPSHGMPSGRVVTDGRGEMSRRASSAIARSAKDANRQIP